MTNKTTAPTTELAEQDIRQMAEEAKAKQAALALSPWVILALLATIESQRQVIAGQGKLSRELATLNHKQILDLLDAVKDDDDSEAEVTLIAHDAPFKSTDGDDMAAGLYFYWTEYPEEGIVPLFDAAPVAPHQESAA